MKRFISVILVLLLSVGCGKSFKKVQCVEYSVGNEKTTIYSLSYYELGEIVPVTTEEYNNAPTENKITPTPIYAIINIDTEQSNIIKVDDFLYHLGAGTYCKRKVISVEIRFVSVQIINDKTIKIKTYNDEISTISTDSYKITYFK